MRELQPPEVARGLALATNLFRDMLHGDYGHAGRHYLDARQVSPALVHTYGLGMGLVGYRAVLESWGVSTATQTELGLLDDRARETMVDRITFPWLSIAGTRVIGIGGRSIRTDERRPKYDNSPERRWFAKGRAVFGLAQAAQSIHGTGWAFMVEGPFDNIALGRMGWTNACSTVGAKVTVDQLLLVARLTNRIVTMFDGDEGGRRGREALQKLIERHWLPAGLEISTAILRGAKDAGDGACTVAMVQDALGSALPAAHS